jgi:hypothetical protein
MLLVLGLMAGSIIFYVWSLAWLFHDAKQRGCSGWSLVLLVGFFAWPIGLLIWLLARPPVSPGTSVRHHLDGTVSCRRCGSAILYGYAICPNCGELPDTTRKHAP